MNLRSTPKNIWWKTASEWTFLKTYFLIDGRLKTQIKWMFLRNLFVLIKNSFERIKRFSSKSMLMLKRWREQRLFVAQRQTATEQLAVVLNKHEMKSKHQQKRWKAKREMSFKASCQSSSFELIKNGLKHTKCFQKCIKINYIWTCVVKHSRFLLRDIMWSRAARRIFQAQCKHDTRSKMWTHKPSMFHQPRPGSRSVLSRTPKRTVSLRGKWWWLNN